MRNPHQCNELALVPGADRDLNENDAPGSPWAPLPTLLLTPAQAGGQPGSLDLDCIGLSPTTPCRFILAHGTPLTENRGS